MSEWCKRIINQTSERSSTLSVDFICLLPTVDWWGFSKNKVRVVGGVNAKMGEDVCLLVSQVENKCRLEG